MASENDNEIERTDELTVATADKNMRVDAFLARQFPDFSRVYFQRIIKDGGILVNGQNCRAADRLKENDVVAVHWPEVVSPGLIGEDIGLDVLYEDEDLLVLNKPPGLVVHPAKGNWTGTLVHGLLHHDEESFGELVDDELRPGIVHRLDKDTSGVMVVAKTERSKLSLSRCFAERNVEKTYLAIVLGEFGAKTGRIEGNIGRHPQDRKRMAVLYERGKPAVSLYRVLASTPLVTLIEVRILTGRTHQIRVHFSHLHHPIVGDGVYGGRRSIGVPVKRQMLHAWKLAFPHPSSGKMMEFMAPPPPDFREAMTALGLPPLSHEDDGDTDTDASA